MDLQQKSQLLSQNSNDQDDMHMDTQEFKQQAEDIYNTYIKDNKIGNPTQQDCEEIAKLIIITSFQKPENQKLADYLQEKIELGGQSIEKLTLEGILNKLAELQLQFEDENSQQVNQQQQNSNQKQQQQQQGNQQLQQQQQLQNNNNNNGNSRLQQQQEEVKDPKKEIHQQSKISEKISKNYKHNRQKIDFYFNKFNVFIEDLLSENENKMINLENYQEFLQSLFSKDNFLILDKQDSNFLIFSKADNENYFNQLKDNFFKEQETSAKKQSRPQQQQQQQQLQISFDELKELIDYWIRTDEDIYVQYDNDVIPSASMKKQNSKKEEKEQEIEFNVPNLEYKPNKQVQQLQQQPLQKQKTKIMNQEIQFYTNDNQRSNSLSHEKTFINEVDDQKEIKNLGKNLNNTIFKYEQILSVCQDPFEKKIILNTLETLKRQLSLLNITASSANTNSVPKNMHFEQQHQQKPNTTGNPNTGVGVGRNQQQNNNNNNNQYFNFHKGLNNQNSNNNNNNNNNNASKKFSKRKESLTEIFDFYCKQNYAYGGNVTFDRIQHESNVMTLAKFVQFCRDFQFTKKISRDKQVEGFKKFARFSKEASLEDFLFTLDHLAKAMYPDSQYSFGEQISEEYKLEQLYIFMDLDDPAKFRSKMNLSHLPFHSRGTRLESSEVGAGYKFEFYAHTGKTPEEVKNELIKRKMVKLMQRLPLKPFKQNNNNNKIDSNENSNNQGGSGQGLLINNKKLEMAIQNLYLQQKLQQQQQKQPSQQQQQQQQKSYQQQQQQLQDVLNGYSNNKSNSRQNNSNLEQLYAVKSRRQSVKQLNKSGTYKNQSPSLNQREGNSIKKSAAADNATTQATEINTSNISNKITWEKLEGNKFVQNNLDTDLNFEELIGDEQQQQQYDEDDQIYLAEYAEQKLSNNAGYYDNLQGEKNNYQYPNNVTNNNKIISSRQVESSNQNYQKPGNLSQNGQMVNQSLQQPLQQQQQLPHQIKQNYNYISHSVSPNLNTRNRDIQKLQQQVQQQQQQQVFLYEMNRNNNINQLVNNNNNNYQMNSSNNSQQISNNQSYLYPQNRGPNNYQPPLQQQGDYQKQDFRQQGQQIVYPNYQRKLVAPPVKSRNPQQQYVDSRSYDNVINTNQKKENLNNKSNNDIDSSQQKDILYNYIVANNQKKSEPNNRYYKH